MHKIMKSKGGDWRVYDCDETGKPQCDSGYSVLEARGKFSVFDEDGEHIATDLNQAQAEALMNA